MVQKWLNHLSLHFWKRVHTRFLKLVGVSNKPFYIFGRHVGLVLNKDHGLGRSGKLRKEERLYRLPEESVLGFFAIMIHAVSENGEINAWLFQKQVIFVVSVSVDKSHHAANHLHFLILYYILQKWSSKHLFNEPFYNFFHAFLTNFGKAYFLEFVYFGEIVLVFGLVKFIHSPEAGSQKEKVELFGLFVTSEVRWTLKRVKRVLNRDLWVRPFLTGNP